MNLDLYSSVFESLNTIFFNEAKQSLAFKLQILLLVILISELWFTFMQNDWVY